MKKKILIKENELVELIQRVITEQAWLRKLVGNSVDDLIRSFGDDAVKTIEITLSKALQNTTNYIAKNGQTFLKSASGSLVPMETIEKAIKVISQGKTTVDEIANLLPRQLADGTEFREVFRNSLSKKATASTVGKNILGAFEQKFALKNCFNVNYCDTKTIINAFYNKISNLARFTQFNPSKVKLLQKTTVAGREVCEIQVEDGTKVLFYKSSGANVATTGKEAGEWFVIPGFAENGWFVKTQETVNLTKGGNKYLTDMANFLKTNGVSKLGN